ncbi:MAG: nucleoid-associated protein YejK [Moritella sp.]|uniref:nucleoid-associated protein YejK n=1 Tax=unclassified Moritella TaxID=2637987 RepID=UPI000156919E|nr:MULTISPECIES: nucleoid-associated protein YejK [unclassified Moritella]EDM64650.1 37 kDa nucleoid-associated protein [Moritella sp. PE36]MBL1417189.1 nucleoid-associated protein YejK [Moritella sp.]
MQLKLNNIILHSLAFNTEGELKCYPRSEELVNSEPVEELASELHRIYNAKPAKGFGYFKCTEEDNSRLPFEVELRKFIDEESNFVDFSSAASNLLVAELLKYDFGTQGILSFVHYNWMASDYLIVALLENKDSVMVTEQLDLSNTHYLELSKVQLAAKIDLTEWRQNSDSKRYLSFIKGRAGRKVSDFFLDFLGCTEGMDAKLQNAGLMRAVDEFCHVAELDAEESIQAREQVAQYCNEQIKEGNEIEIKDLSDHLADVSSRDFYQYASEAYELEDSFPADRGAVRKLTKYVGQGGGLSISFDQKLMAERISYDAQTDTLTIVGIPPNLREQLIRRSISGEEQE